MSTVHQMLRSFYSVKLKRQMVQLECLAEERGSSSSRRGKMWYLAQKKGRSLVQIFGTKLCSNPSPALPSARPEGAGCSLDVAD